MTAPTVAVPLGGRVIVRRLRPSYGNVRVTYDPVNVEEGTWTMTVPGLDPAGGMVTTLVVEPE